jgi:hypothetical protein
MNRLSALALLVMLTAPAAAAAAHDWYVVKVDGQIYAYDLAAVENVHDASVKSVGIYVDATKGGTNVLYFIDCATGRGSFVGSLSDDNMIMTEGSAKPSSSGWSAIPETGSMKVAADVACSRRVTGALHADSQQDAFDKLKTLSN